MMPHLLLVAIFVNFVNRIINTMNDANCGRFMAVVASLPQDALMPADRTTFFAGMTKASALWNAVDGGAAARLRLRPARRP